VVHWQTTPFVPQGVPSKRVFVRASPSPFKLSVKAVLAFVFAR